MLGIIKDGVFKAENKRKILFYIDENGKKVSVLNPKENHFKVAEYKKIIFKNDNPEVKENQYVDIVYSDKSDYIEAEYVIKDFEE